MHEPASVYLAASRRLEEQTEQLRDLGMMLSNVGEVLAKDWKKVTPVGDRSAPVSDDFSSPQCALELNVDEWPNAASLSELLAAAHRTLAEVTAAWQAIPSEWRSLLSPPAVADSGTVEHHRVA